MYDNKSLHTNKNTPPPKLFNVIGRSTSTPQISDIIASQKKKYKNNDIPNCESLTECESTTREFIPIRIQNKPITMDEALNTSQMLKFGFPKPKQKCSVPMYYIIHWCIFVTALVVIVVWRLNIFNDNEIIRIIAVICAFIASVDMFIFIMYMLFTAIKNI
jgi:hypothetical protein